jgi:septum formation protein
MCATSTQKLDSGTMTPDVYLASSSPRRKELLAQLRVRFAVINPLVDESRLADEPAEHYVARVALDKARAGRRILFNDEPPIQIPVIGADTCIVIDDEPVGKPADKQHFLWLIAKLSGTTHRVYTAVAIAGNPVSGITSLSEPVTSPSREKCLVSCTSVQFREISPQEREWYWQCGEPQDKAGGYAIQGLAAAFVKNIQGSFSGVVGLPLFETAQLLNDFGINILHAVRE